MSCPWCGSESRWSKGTKPRPSTKPTRICPDCFGEVPRPEVKDDGAPTGFAEAWERAQDVD